MARILLIDDELLVREMMRITLTEAGHSVATATNGKEGLLQVDTLRPDLIITDIVMPEQEGIETIRAIRKTNAKTPIIAISGGASGKLDFLRAAAALGATRTLRKPFGSGTLLATVNECLAERPA
jgi:CheY-like chemotaxis protein